MTPEEIIGRLEEAGATLLAMHLPSYTPKGYGNSWPEPVHDYEEAYGYTPTSMRAAIPNAATISRMDEAFSWIHYIPDDKFVLRRVVRARSLIHPTNYRHIYTWKRIARLVKADHRAIRRWYFQGIAIIAQTMAAKSPLAQSARFGAQKRV